MTSLHLEAAIAASHGAAPNFAETDWARILSLYDDLVALDASPVTALNRAVVLAKVHGATVALQELRELAAGERLSGYYLYHAILG